MGVLRQRLAEFDPALSAALERSWAIAGREWLPAVRPSEGSFNSGPHLENMERYLDQLVIGFGEIPSCRSRLNLRPVELYLLLAGVLFHDLGRTKTEEEHGLAGDLMLRDEYAHLGIPSKELARVLGAFCVYHNPPKHKKQRTQVDPSHFGDVVIDPYGPIRCRSLAALIRLVDQIDGAYTRTLPRYLKAREGLGIVGLFRKVVRGVHIDQHSRMIRTVISDELPGAPWAREDRSLGVRGATAVRTPMARYARKPGTTTKPIRPLVENAFASSGHGQPYSLPQIVHREAGGRGGRGSSYLYGLTPKDWRVTRGWTEVRSDLKQGHFLPPETLLAVIMGDVRHNSEVLTEIQTELASIGMPLAAWLIDYKEHLYDDWGRETYEPLFTADRLEELVDGMWELSVQVFGTSQFTYEDLASQIGDPDVVHVKIGVRRVAILTRDSRRTGRGRDNGTTPSLPAVWAGDTEWRWNVRGRESSRAKVQCCDYATLSSVIRTIPAAGA